MLLQIPSKKRPIELHVHSKVHYKGKYQTKTKKIEEQTSSSARPSPEVAAYKRYLMATWKLWKVLLLDKLITKTAKKNPLKTIIVVDRGKCNYS